MFDNIGGKIRVLAVIFLIVGVLASLIIGFSQISEASEIADSYYVSSSERELAASMRSTGRRIILGGSFGTLVGAYILYGFGELVENMSFIRRKLCDSTNSPQEVYNVKRIEDERIKKILNKTNTPQDERIKKLDAMLQEGLINQREYNIEIESIKK